MYNVNKIKVDDLEISFLDNNRENKKVLLFVHGWGADKKNLKAIYDNLSINFRIISIDLPGFGESGIPSKIIGSIEYAEYINKFLNIIGLSRINYIGHSFGGKIGIVLSVLYPELIEKLILIDSTGIRAKRNPSWYINVYSFKILKFFFQNIINNKDYVLKLKNKFGSTDYKNAGLMRDIMVKNVSEDFSEYLPCIKCSVFLYWGEKDNDTPLWMGKKMHRLIKDSGLYIVKNGGHFSFLDDDRIIPIIYNFVRS